MINDKHTAFMLEAINEAKKAYALGEVPIGAVIVRNGEILSRAHNQTEKDQNPLGHAEILAIERATKKLGTRRLQDCTLYVTLEPCAMCSGAIVLSRIPIVYFSSVDPKSGAVESLYGILSDKRLNHECEIHQGLLENESSMLLKDFFVQLRNGSIEKTIMMKSNDEA